MSAIPGDVSSVVSTAIMEDVGNNDLTASLIPAACLGRARVICREDAIMCGVPWFDEVFRQMDPHVRIEWRFNDGDEISENDCICLLEGSMRILLSGERTALNFIQLLSGTATVAKRYAQLVTDYPCEILDTRKTIPGLRTAQKYAVSCGGASNHRMGLYDAILIKENHILAAGSIHQAVEHAFRDHPDVDVEVEVESMEELAEAIEAGCTHVLLDNFSLEMMKEAVECCQGKIKLEASGGISEEQLIEIARMGVDYISIGALTKHVRAIDYSMRFDD